MAPLRYNIIYQQENSCFEDWRECIILSLILLYWYLTQIFKLQKASAFKLIIINGLESLLIRQDMGTSAIELKAFLFSCWTRVLGN